MRAAPPELVVVDIETTGLDPERDRIIDIGAVRLGRDLDVSATFTTLVDPGIPIPLAVSRLTDLETVDLKGAPSFSAAFPALAEFAGSAVLVGHNASFDRAHLAAEARRSGLLPLGNTWFDTLEAALLLFPELDRHALPLLAEAFGLEHVSHRALPDARTTARVLSRLRARAAGLGETERRLLSIAEWEPLDLLDSLEAAAADPPPPTPSEPPAIATALAMLPVEMDAWRSELVAAEGAARASEQPRMASRLQGFRRRPSQAQLAEAVAAVTAAGGIGLFEAGTGMGKSLAYLLPAAFSSAATGRRVVVSTKTKALQRQLAAQELPLVAAALPPEWRWALLMGRENYICRRRLDEAVAATSEALPDRDRALALAYLAGRSRRGEVDLSALPFRASRELPSLRDLARELRSSRATCMGRRCPARRGCPWRLARSRAEASHLVCVNHALLLTGRETLPPFEDVVIDEAHLLYHEATEVFSEGVDAAALDLVLIELRGHRRQRSLAQRLRTAARRAPQDEAPALTAAADACDRAAGNLPALIDGVESALVRLAVAHREDAADTRAARPREGEYNLTVWLTRGLRERAEWEPLSVAAGLLAEALSALAADLRPAAEALPEGHRDQAAVVTLSAEAASFAELLSEIPEGGDDETVAWGEVGATGSLRLQGGPRWMLRRAPITPARHISEALWDRLRSAVLTSATLTVAGSFAYFRSMTGLAAELDVDERVFPSPFDFRRQAVLVVEHDPEGAWRPDDLARRQGERLKRLAEVTGGRTLALFTNKRDMTAVAASVGAHVEDEGVLVLAQGLHGTAAALAEEFRAHPETILLGVDTLWTGQDFPGDALTCLVIAKLPFPRQDPLFRARRQAFLDAGVDWFRAFYLPEAVLKFRQGFGRLIRTETDAGVVVVLDHRLTQRGYGRDFIASLPDLEVVRAAPEELAKVVEAHLGLLTGAGRGNRRRPAGLS